VDILIARLLHIGAGVIWAGTAITLARFVEPTVNEIGTSGQAFMQALERRGFTRFVLVVAVTGILSGLYLYWRVSGGLQPQWITSGTGVVLTVGAIAALVAFSFGPIFYIPSSKRIEEITHGMGSGGPSPEQRSQLQAITQRLARVGVWSALLLAFTTICMAGARYIGAALPQ
jgi:hypothetical protein